MTKFKLLVFLLFAIFATPYAKSLEILEKDDINYSVSGAPLSYESFIEENYKMTAQVRGLLKPKESVNIKESIKVELKFIVRNEAGWDTIISIEKVPVISISSGAFAGQSMIEGISIPESVTSIGSGAFANCTSLKSASVPASVEEAGSEMFKGCTSLESASWGAKILSGGAFYGCTNLTSVGICDGVEYVDNGAFRGCSSLNLISFPSSVKEIGTTIGSVYGAVLGDCTSLTAVHFADAEKLGSIFNNNPKLTEIVIPSSVKNMYPLGSGLTGLKTLIFNPATEPLKLTGNIINYYMPLEHIVIGRPLETSATLSGCKTLRTANVIGMGNIPNNFFSGCTELRIVNFKSSVIGYSAFDGCSSLYSVNGVGANLLGVKELQSDAFKGCSSIRSITWGALSDIPRGAFSGCSSLTLVILPHF